MIITNIIGGLGNQMFQYAAGRAAAYHNKTDLAIDIMGYKRPNHQRHQGYELGRVFKVDPVEIDQDELKDFLGWRANDIVRRILKLRALSKFRRNYIIEPHFHYWNKFKNIKNDSYLSGYWQSEKYFVEIERLIRKDFEFDAALSELNCYIADDIKINKSVSIHVRRGDLITDRRVSKLMIPCSIEYYINAMKYYSTSLTRPKFYIFSDDPDWVKNNFPSGFNFEIIQHNSGENSYIDMQLMSLCEHHIISNSSFSWWGAWLNPSTAKCTIAPKLWFQNNYNPDDLRFGNWIQM